MIKEGIYKLITPDGSVALFELKQLPETNFGIEILSDPDNLMQDLSNHNKPIKTLFHLARNPYYTLVKISDELLTKSGPDESDEPELKINDINDLNNILSTSDFALLSAYRADRKPEENEQKNKELLQDILNLGYKYTPIKGKWSGSEEPSYMIHDISEHDASHLSRKYNQLAHIQSRGGYHREISHSPEYKPLDMGQGHEILDDLDDLDDNYSEVTLKDGTKAKFRIKLNPSPTK